MSKRVLLAYREEDRVGSYRAALQMAGIEPVLAKPSDAVSLDAFDGLVLSGGSDVNPALYGVPKHVETDEPDDERDSLEFRLLTECFERDLPLLAICRGMQILNVYQGGTLVQHLSSPDRHVRRTPDRGLPAHAVSIEPGTLLSSIAGREQWEVNSRHHQAIDKLGNDLRVCARDANDQTIEAIERSDKRFALAVQWHPEDQAPSDPEQLKLFQSFARAL